MGTAVLHAQDCLSPYQNNRHEGFIGVVYHATARSKSKSPQSRSKKSGQGNGSGYGYGSSPRKAKASQEKKRTLKPKAQEKTEHKAEEKAEDEVLTGKRLGKSQNYHKHNGKSNVKEQTPRNDPIMGQVTILKRGQAVESSSHMMGRLGVSPPKSAQITRSAGFEPENAVKKSKSKSRVEEWAGPAFANSPSPSCVPLPKFSVKKTATTIEGEKAEEEELTKIDRYATMDLRRLLGLG